MTLYGLLLIALALSLDAFGVSLSIGLNPNVRFINKLIFCISFGFFQFGFSLVGSYAGSYFTTYVAAVPAVIGGVIIGIVGVLMVKDGMEEKEECLLFTPRMYIILGASVSIDALVIGFTAFGNIHSSFSILLYTIVIGIVTFIISAAAFILSKYLKKISIVARYADYIGGIILILFGLKMIFIR
ncbi:MAG: manganese efflux pump [Bacillota bacterium]|nr:manganese efflux pump [Bacillota bacterium]